MEPLSDGFQLSLVLQNGSAEIPLLLEAGMLLPTSLAGAGIVFPPAEHLQLLPRAPLGSTSSGLHQQGGVAWEFVHKNLGTPSCPCAQHGCSWSFSGCLIEVGAQMSLSFVEI